MKTKRRITRRLLKVPIYHAEVMIVFTNDVVREAKRWEWKFGALPSDCYAAVAWTPLGEYVIILPFTDEPYSVVAHEVFHLTHRILDWTKCNFDPNHHEQAALLCEYLTGEVLKVEKRSWCKK